jgi:triosephosphate isomerase (TIM)
MNSARKPLVVGNWKMFGDLVANDLLLTALRNTLNRALTARVEVGVCPPAVYLGQVTAWLSDTDISLGAQNVAANPNGAFTGEISAAMLADMRCAFSLVGHSERRQLGETDLQVAAKATRLIEQNLGVIVCVGETLAQREAGETSQVIAGQVHAVLEVLRTAAPAKAVIAYEPVWAIGTGRTATSAQAQEVHAQIRAQLIAAGLPGNQIRIVYGGSVKPANAAELFAQPDIDGGLIGGASLVADDFTAICRAALLPA